MLELVWGFKVCMWLQIGALEAEWWRATPVGVRTCSGSMPNWVHLCPTKLVGTPCSYLNIECSCCPTIPTVVAWSCRILTDLACRRAWQGKSLYAARSLQDVERSSRTKSLVILTRAENNDDASSCIQRDQPPQRYVAT